MPNNWPSTTIGQVTSRVTKGTTPTTLGGKFVDFGVNFVKVESLAEDGRILTDKLAHIDIQTDALLPRSRLEADDILFTIAGTIGRTAIVPKWLLPANTNQAVAIVRPNQSVILPRFLFYVLRDETRITHARTRVVQSVQANFSLSELSSLEIPLPPFRDQKAIASVLGAFDSLIELNRQMNTTLEAMARALFQSWFVDFDPVRAKLDGIKPIGLDDATVKLFPAAFQDSALGHIPQGWEIRSLDKTADYLNGLALQKYPPSDGPTFPVIKIAQLRKGDVIGADRCNTELPQQYVVEDGDVLFSWSGSLEVDLWCGGTGALNQHLFKVTSQEFPKWFYYLWTLHHLDEFRLIAASKATTMGHIQRSHITDAKVVVPPRILLDAMTQTMSPIIDQLIANRIQSRSLAVLRDTLLPKLLSGDLSVENLQS
jgi:type I restriction enzyme S subunit